MADACSASHGHSHLQVYVQLRPAELPAGNGAFLLLGCFDEGGLRTRGLTAPPAASLAAKMPPGSSSGAVSDCSQGCSGFRYFGVRLQGSQLGPSEASGAWCACGELEPVAWERDRQGMAQLKRQQIRPLEEG